MVSEIQSNYKVLDEDWGTVPCSSILLALIYCMFLATDKNATVRLAHGFGFSPSVGRVEVLVGTLYIHSRHQYTSTSSIYTHLIGLFRWPMGRCVWLQLGYSRCGCRLPSTGLQEGDRSRRRRDVHIQSWNGWHSLVDEQSDMQRKWKLNPSNLCLVTLVVTHAVATGEFCVGVSVSWSG